MQENTAQPISEEVLDTYAILDLFGHTRIAGRVRNAQIAGAGMIRVEVLDSEGNERNTEYYSPQAVYSLKPVTKELAIAAARQLDSAPVSAYSIRHALKDMDRHGLASLSRAISTARKQLKSSEEEGGEDEQDGDELDFSGEE